MLTNKRIWLIAVVTILIACLSNIGFASVLMLEPAWDAPGGYEVNYNGLPGHTGGLVGEYTGFNPESYGDLYYVIGDYDYSHPDWIYNAAGPSIGTNINGMTRLLYNAGSSNLNAGLVIWTGTIAIYDVTAWGGTGGDRNFSARFVLEVKDSSGIPASLSEPSMIPGMPASVGGAHTVQDGFSTSWRFQLYNGGWQPANSVFDAIHNAPGDQLRTSIGEAFYFTPIPGDDDVDFDIDGSDVVAFINSAEPKDLATFAANFGKSI